MNKKDLIDRLASENGMSRLEARKVVDLLFQRMSDTLANGDRIEFRGLGAFSIKKYDAYQGRNPRTGAGVKVNPKKLPFFKVGKDLKERVNSQ